MMTTLMTMQHNWVKHTITKVSAIPDFDDDDKVVVVEDPTDVEAAELGAVFGCNTCGVPMESNTDTICNPTCYCGIKESNHYSVDPPHSFVLMGG